MPVGPNAPYSALDFSQIIQRVFDETNDRLRIDLNATVTTGQVEVAINHVDDSIKIGNGSNFLLIDGTGRLTVKLQDASGNNLNSTSNALNTFITNSSLNINLRDNTGTPFSNTNPLEVTFVENLGTKVISYNSSLAIIPAAFTNHDYTVTAGKTFKLTQVVTSSNGDMEVDVQIESGVGTGIFNPYFTLFGSIFTVNPSITLSEYISVNAGVRVRIVKTNTDTTNIDAFSTIMGYEI